VISSNLTVVEPYCICANRPGFRRVNLPAAGVTATPAKVIAKTIERYKKGERVVALAKELGVSEAAVYIWIKSDRAKELERVKRAGITPQNAAKADKRDLALENKALREENERLWSKVRELMLKTGEL
jgi:predicted transcriptional regulator